MRKKYSRTAVDRVVEWWNPKEGMKRRAWRAKIASLNSGGYVSGARDRRATRNWRPNEASANQDILDDLPDLRARSRDLARNVPIAAGAIHTNCTNVVGDGLALKSEIDREMLGLSEDEAKAWQKKAQREFSLAAKRMDLRGVLGFDRIQDIVLRTWLESGDAFVVKRFQEYPGDTYGLKLQLVEADRISNPDRARDTKKIAGGIEHDTNGRPIACYVANKHPDDIKPGGTEWVRVPFFDDAGNRLVLHIYDQLRIDQSRGVPYLAPVVETIKQLGDYGHNEALAAVVSSMFTVFVKTTDLDDDDGPIGDSSAAGLADDETELGPGAVVELAADEDVSIANPQRPNTAFEGFVTALFRQIGMALELPYEVLIKHFSASYSASRAALEMAWQSFRRRRAWLKRSLCEPVYEWAITEAVARGRLSAPGFFADPLIRQAYLGCDWIGASRIQLDPLKEANADKVDLATGAKTLDQVITERTGGSWERKHEQRALEVRKRREDGLTEPDASVDADKTETDQEDEEDDVSRASG